MPYVCGIKEKNNLKVRYVQRVIILRVIFYCISANCEPLKERNPGQTPALDDGPGVKCVSYSRFCMFIGKRAHSKALKFKLCDARVNTPSQDLLVVTPVCLGVTVLDRCSTKRSDVCDRYSSTVVIQVDV